LVARGNDPQVGITASQATISLRLRTEAADVATANAKLEPVVETIHRCLGSLVFGEGDQELEDVVIDQLMRRGQRLVVVEWGTRGLVAQRLDEASGRWRESVTADATHALQSADEVDGAMSGQAGESEAGFSGGVILTQWDAVRRWLAPEVEWSGATVPPWPEVVAALATVAGQRFQADLVLAAGPLPHGPNSLGSGPAAEFQLTLCERTGPKTRQFPQAFTVLGHPSLWRPRAAKQMLNHLRLLWLDGTLDSADANL
jgi:nicotinamide-nucleotide amidase